MHNWIGSRHALAAVGMLVAMTLAASADAGERQEKKQKGLWPLGGRDIRNTRHQRAEDTINVDNAAFLQVRWTADTGGAISATPAVDESSVYVPDWVGKVYAFNRHTGVTQWSRTIASITGVEAGCTSGLSPGTDFARATPTIAGDLLILGDPGGRCSAGARVFAIDKRTGTPKWVTQIDTDFAAIVTQPATVDPRDPPLCLVAKQVICRVGRNLGSLCAIRRGLINGALSATAPCKLL